MTTPEGSNSTQDPPADPALAQLQSTLALEQAARQALEQQLAELKAVTVPSADLDAVKGQLSAATVEVTRLKAAELKALQEYIQSSKGLSADSIKDLTLEQLQLLNKHVPPKTTIPTSKGLDLQGNGGSDQSSLTSRDKIRAGLK